MRRLWIMAFNGILITCLVFVNTTNVFARQMLPLNSNPTSAAAVSTINVPGVDLQTAINTVASGGVIEIATGTYTAPGNGWQITNPDKYFTIRAAQGAQVTLSGGNSTDIVRMNNTSTTLAGSVVFENLIFSSGYSNTNGIAGGMSISRGRATFIGCTFSNNKANNISTVGGAIYIIDNSEVYFLNSTFDSNTSTFGGAGIGVRIHSKVYIHNSRFTNNHTNVAGHVQVAPGGGINAADSIVRISNTRFEGNQAQGHGGGFYALGSKNDAWRTDVILANDLFINNLATSDGSFQAEGGGVNVEDNTTIKIYNSRFITNTANIAGGANDYRAQMEIYNSAFLGNQASDPGDLSSGFGGAISINSDDDNPGDGYTPLATLIVEDTLFQGRYGSVGAAAQSSACIHTKGNEVGMGSNYAAAANYRTNVTLRRDVFYDCDISNSAAVNGGMAEFALTNLVMEDTIVANSDVLTAGNGGAIVFDLASTADIARSFFVHNSAKNCGGAINLMGASMNLHESVLARNSASTGANYYNSCGGAIFTAMDGGRNLGSGGIVQNNHFSQNVGMAVNDYDQGNPNNSVIYNGNQFNETSFAGGSDYWFSGPHFSGNLTAAGLNSLVTFYGVDKSPQNNNSDIGSYVFGTIRAVPSKILPSGANGEAGSVPAYFGYVWSGASATYNGSAVANYAGISSSSSAGISTLLVGSNSYQSSLVLAPSPSATFQTNCGGANLSLNWAVTSGTFLEAAIDRGVTITSAVNGNVAVSAPLGTSFHFYAITKEGGIMIEQVPSTALLSAPDSVTIYANSLSTHNYGGIPISNLGSCTLSWSTSTSDPNLITVLTLNGQTPNQSQSQVLFSVVSHSNGIYRGQVNLNAGSAGIKSVGVTVNYISMPNSLFIPSIRK